MAPVSVRLENNKLLALCLALGYRLQNTYFCALPTTWSKVNRARVHKAST